MSEKPAWKLKLLFDGQCPFCALESRWLRTRDKHGRLLFEDISQPDFDPSRYGLTRDQLMGVMHAVLPDGRIVTKLEVFRQAYQHVGLGWLLAPTRWPVINKIADAGYELFARYRIPLGRIFGARPCPNGTCKTKP